MTAKRDQLVYVDDILQSIILILNYTHDTTENDLEKSDLLRDAIILRFEVIGEASAQLSEVFKKQHPQIPWRLMADMRNKLIHEYFEADWHIIWKTIQEDLPRLKEQLEKLV